MPDGGRRHLVVIYVLRLCKCQVLYHKRLTTIPDTWIFHLHMRSSGGVGRVALQDGQSLLKFLSDFVLVFAAIKKRRDEDSRSSVPILRTAGRHWPAAVRTPSAETNGLTC